jgi:MSHA pilin protein MshD
MVETAFALLLVGGALTVSLNATACMHATQKKESDRIRGQLLAINLLTEIMAQPYQERSGTPAFGLETGESGATRALFDDVDDYKAYSESPPTAKDGTVVDGFSGWTRSVTIVRADPANLNTISFSETGVKKITVTVKAGTRTLASVAAVRSGAMAPAGESHLLKDVVDYLTGGGLLN